MPNHYINNAILEKNISKYQECKRNKLKYEILISEINSTIERKSSRSKDTSAELSLLEEHKTKYESSQQSKQEIEVSLMEDFYKLSENLSRYARFAYIEPDDAIQEGVVICLERTETFDPTKGKAFNYMTTCIYNQLKQIYKVAKGYNEFKKKRAEMLRNS